MLPILMQPIRMSAYRTTTIDEHEGLAEHAVAYAEGRGFDYAEAFIESYTGTFYAVEQGALNSSSYFEKTGIRLRLIRKGRLHVFATNRLDRRTLERAIEGSAGFSGADTCLSKESVRRASYRIREKRVADGPRILEDLVALDKTLGGERHVKFRSVYGGAGRATSLMVNSEGSRIESSVPRAEVFVSMIVGSGGQTRQRVLQLGGVGGYEAIEPIGIETRALDEARALLNVMEHGVTLSGSRLRSIKNVVISPEIAGIAAHESVGHPDEADRVFLREAAQAGTSYLNRDNLGMGIGSERVSIIDDPTIKGSFGFYLYDDEGVRARPRKLVTNGTQDELLMNREYASVMGTRSNGASRSDSYEHEPIVRMANTYLKPGGATHDELISEAGNGVYIKSFMEWNIDDTRSFSRYQGSEAYLIENRRLGRPVKNYVLETTTQRFWHAVRLVDDEFELYLGNCGKGEPMQGVPVTMGGAGALLSL